MSGALTSGFDYALFTDGKTVLASWLAALASGQLPVAPTYQGETALNLGSQSRKISFDFALDPAAVANMGGILDLDGGGPNLVRLTLPMRGAFFLAKLPPLAPIDIPVLPLTGICTIVAPITVETSSAGGTKKNAQVVVDMSNATSSEFALDQASRDLIARILKKGGLAPLSPTALPRDVVAADIEPLLSAGLLALLKAGRKPPLTTPILLQPDNASPTVLKTLNARILVSAGQEPCLVLFGATTKTNMNGGDPAGFTKSLTTPGKDIVLVLNASTIVLEALCTGLSGATPAIPMVANTSGPAGCHQDTDAPLSSTMSLHGLTLTVGTSGVGIAGSIVGDGTGWSLDGPFTGNVTIALGSATTDGLLTTAAMVTAGDVEFSFDWWVYLIIAAIGVVAFLLTGGAATLIGAAAGSAGAAAANVAAGIIVGVLVTWLVEELIESFMQEVVEGLITLITPAMSLSLPLPLGAISFIPADVVLDDLVLSGTPMWARARGRSSGRIALPTGFAFDLDDGCRLSLAAGSIPYGADFSWERFGKGRVFNPLNGAAFARIDAPYDSVSLMSLRGAAFLPGFRLTAAGLPRPGEPPLVLGAITGDKRHARLAIYGASGGTLDFDFETFDELVPSAGIAGEFDESAARMDSSESKPVQIPHLELGPDGRRTLDWETKTVTSTTYVLTHKGTFAAETRLVAPPVRTEWAIGGAPLTGSGNVRVGGASLAYAVGADGIVLETQPGKDYEFDLVLTANGAGGETCVARRSFRLSGRRTDHPAGLTDLLKDQIRRLAGILASGPLPPNPDPGPLRLKESAALEIRHLPERRSRPMLLRGPAAKTKPQAAKTKRKARRPS